MLLFSAATAAPQSLDWLIHPPSEFPQATVSQTGDALVLTNGLVTRTWAMGEGMFVCTGYQREASDGLQQPTDLLRAIKPEALVSLDGVEFGTLVQEVGRTLASRAAALCTPLQAPSHDALRNPRARVGAGGCAA